MNSRRALPSLSVHLSQLSPPPITPPPSLQAVGMLLSGRKPRPVDTPGRCALSASVLAT